MIRRDGAETADVRRLDNPQRPFEEPATVSSFVGPRRAIAGRAAAENVADEYLFSLESAAVDEAVKHLPGAADKRFAAAVFVSPRRFADEAHLRIERAHAEHRLRPRRRQFPAGLAAFHFLDE